MYTWDAMGFFTAMTSLIYTWITLTWSPKRQGAIWIPGSRLLPAILMDCHYPYMGGRAAIFRHIQNHILGCNPIIPPVLPLKSRAFLGPHVLHGPPYGRLHPGSKGQSPKSVPRAKDRVKVQSHTSSGHQYLGSSLECPNISFTCWRSWNIPSYIWTICIYGA